MHYFGGHFMSRVAFLAGLLLLFSCGQLSRDDLLSGNFGTVDKSPPNLIAPLNNETFDVGDVTFAWTQNRFAREYTLELAEDENFTQPMTGSPFQVKSTTHTVNVTQAKSYYWRVKNNLSDTYSPVRAIHLLDNNLYVYCPPDKATCSNDGRYGNLSRPYEVIAPVIPVAKALGKPVLVARRSNSVYYTEAQTILLQDGVTLKGGYDALTWTQDLAQPTLVRTTAAQGVSVVGTRSATLFEGFRLEAQGDFAVWISDANQNFVLQHNVIAGRGGTGNGYGIYLEQGTVTIRNNVILGGSAATNSYGVYAINQVAPLLYRNLISGGVFSSGARRGLYFENGGYGILASNQIYGGHGAFTYGLSHSTAGNYGLRLMQNYVHGGNAGTGSSDSSIGLEFNTSSSGLISTSLIGNTISAGFGTNKVGVGTSNTQYQLMDQNLYFNFVSTPNSYCHNGISTQLNRFFRYNSLAACDTALWHADFISGGTSYTQICGGILGHSGCSSTLTPTSTAANTNNNRTEIPGDSFAYRPDQIVYAGDGPDAGSIYDGTLNTVELITTAHCNLFNVGEYFQYGNDNTPRQVTAKNCTASASMVTFDPPLVQASLAGMPLLLWGSNNTHYDRRFALKTTSANRGGGLPCTAANFETRTHRWGPATSQAECDARFPAGSTFTSGNCESTFLYPAIEIDAAGNPAGNMLCEANERCLYLQNTGAYQGHGALIAACDVTSVLTGVQLFRFQDNGY